MPVSSTTPTYSWSLSVWTMPRHTRAIMVPPGPGSALHSSQSPSETMRTSPSTTATALWSSIAYRGMACWPDDEHRHSVGGGRAPALLLEPGAGSDRRVVGVPDVRPRAGVRGLPGPRRRHRPRLRARPGPRPQPAADRSRPDPDRADLGGGRHPLEALLPGGRRADHRRADAVPAGPLRVPAPRHPVSAPQRPALDPRRAHLHVQRPRAGLADHALLLHQLRDLPELAGPARAQRAGPTVRRGQRRRVVGRAVLHL